MTAGDMMKETNGFRRLQQRLREEGWYVGWNLPCCSSCAWAELPYEFEDGTDIDLSKVLFNHSQDCEVEPNHQKVSLKRKKKNGGSLSKDSKHCLPKNKPSLVSVLMVVNKA